MFVTSGCLRNEERHQVVELLRLWSVVVITVVGGSRCFPFKDDLVHPDHPLQLTFQYLLWAVDVPCLGILISPGSCRRHEVLLVQMFAEQLAHGTSDLRTILWHSNILCQEGRNTLSLVSIAITCFEALCLKFFL